MNSSVRLPSLSPGEQILIRNLGGEYVDITNACPDAIDVMRKLKQENARLKYENDTLRNSFAFKLWRIFR